MRNETYNPAFSRTESQVEFCESDGCFKLCQIGSDIGLMQTASSDETLCQKEAAFLFGNSPDELYFRFSFSSLMLIEPDRTDHNEKELRERLFKSSNGVYWTHSGDIIPIPVYADATKEINQVKESKDEATALAEEIEFLNPFATKESAKAMAETSIAFYERTHPLDAELEEAINSSLEKFEDARILAPTYYSGATRLYPYCIAKVGRGMVVFVLAHMQCDEAWLADEESHGVRALWMTESYSELSPAWQGMRLREYLQKNYSGEIAIDTIVVCPEKLEICNADEMKDTWDSMNVRICWSKSVHPKCQSLPDVLKAIDFGVGIDWDADYDKVQKTMANFNLYFPHENQDTKKGGE